MKDFAITNSNDIVNLVFSVGTGSPQTVDIENIKATTFINISSEKEGGKNKVNVVSTGIDSIVAEQKGNNAPYYYTLSGQRIAKPTQRGIYILNGKKVLVK